ncbi:CNH domain-containing protein, partial [Cristinia sonorae]
QELDVDLLDKNRTLIHSGKLWRCDTGFTGCNWTEVFMLLTDTHLIVTEPKEGDAITKYHASTRPIPLDLLTSITFTDAPIPKKYEAAGSGSAYPFTVHASGRAGAHTLFAESSHAREQWQQKLEEAIHSRTFPERSEVFKLRSFGTDKVYGGRVTCSVTFMTSDGRKLIAIACDNGVWIGFQDDSTSIRQVLQLKQITQCAVLEENGLLLVLSDKSLYAYPIDSLLTSMTSETRPGPPCQKLSGDKDVCFFRIGRMNNRSLVIYMKKKRWDSVFRVLEPVTNKLKAPDPQDTWFRVFKDFFITGDAHDLDFLKARLVLVGSTGFEILDLIDFKSVVIPVCDDPPLPEILKRCKGSRALAMVRQSEEGFLLCYDDFGIYVNRQGEPVDPVQLVEWEGKAEYVAQKGPYILLFNPQFIEVRNVQSGRLVQIIAGVGVRCLWDGRGATFSPVQKEGTKEEIFRQGPVYGAMDIPDKDSRVTAQHIFELVPTAQFGPATIPLVLSEKSSTAPGESEGSTLVL